jgi:small-conductance mechanosensitive channel
MQPHRSTTIFEIATPHFDAIVAGGIASLAALMAALWGWQLLKLNRSAGLVFAGSILSVVGLAYAAQQFGWFLNIRDFPPRFVLVAAPTLLLFVGLGFSQVGKQLSQAMSLSTLIALQIFRLPLEVLMLRAALLQIMPGEFSMLGYNFDVLTGLGAMLLLGYRALISELNTLVIKAWNIFGLACLVVIAVLAIGTSPQIQAFGQGPEHINTWILFFPYSLLPLLLVSFAVLGHIILSRKLIAQPTQASLNPHPLTFSKQ